MARHSWIQTPNDKADTYKAQDPNRPVPSLPTSHIPAEGQKLYRCGHFNCSWWRVTARGERGGVDYFYFSTNWEKYSKHGIRAWSAYYADGRPKCGEVK